MDLTRALPGEAVHPLCPINTMLKQLVDEMLNLTRYEQLRAERLSNVCANHESTDMSLQSRIHTSSERAWHMSRALRHAVSVTLQAHTNPPSWVLCYKMQYLDGLCDAAERVLRGI